METPQNLPRHLGIILDGNRRWAKEKGLPTLEGHKKGLDVLKQTAFLCKQKGIKILTVFCFSTENWNRSKEEVDYLMNLLHTGFINHFRELKKENIKVKVIGQRQRLPQNVIKEIAATEKETENNDGMVLNIALSYGGRAELVEAIKNIVKKGINPEKITEDTVKENLWTSDVDLIIRTGGEQRISGFLLWHAAYSEFMFVKKYWPDFSETDLDAALIEYRQRQRRFGK